MKMSLKDWRYRITLRPLLIFGVVSYPGDIHPQKKRHKYKLSKSGCLFYIILTVDGVTSLDGISSFATKYPSVRLIWVITIYRLRIYDRRKW
jgi:hypothetical protein